MLSDSACSSTSSPQLDFRLCDGLHKTGFDGKIITFHSVSVGTMRRNVTEHPARSYTKASMIYSGAQGREVEDDDGHRRAPAVGRIDQTRLRSYQCDGTVTGPLASVHMLTSPFRSIQSTVSRCVSKLPVSYASRISLYDHLVQHRSLL